MGNIWQSLTISGLKGKKRVKALIDTRAERSIIRPDIAKEIEVKEYFSKQIIQIDGKKQRLMK